MSVLLRSVKTVVVGSGAAGLAAAINLYDQGERNLAIVTEGLEFGTSVNAGSDKQTYYKLGLSGSEPDSPVALAETYLTGGGADGDLALTEAANSTRAFMKLVDLGVPFPRDEFGQFVGYKTDHDPRKRATSCGPYTSREMCRALIAEAKRRKIEIMENRVVVKLLASRKSASKPAPAARENAEKRRVYGILSVNLSNGNLEALRCKYVVLAVGGPGGFFQKSSYPECHIGGIGLALEAGAIARGLPECQFGMASIVDLTGRKLKADPARIGVQPKEFRWNVSGSYMQALPKFISTAQDGRSDPTEFLLEYFKSPEDAINRVFRKGNQWPFDASKALEGSSFIDLCVCYETEVLGRRVFLDYREDPEGLDFHKLDPEPREHLARSSAFLKTPFARLEKMNPGAIELYRDHGVDLATEPLEIAVCAQHNNGGIAVDSWYRSLNVSGLFAIGEVAGTHGVARPGGSALNAGQVGALRVAELIGRDKSEWTDERNDLYDFDFQLAVSAATDDVEALLERSRESKLDWRAEREETRKRMSGSCGIFRSREKLAAAVEEAQAQLARLRAPRALQDGLRGALLWDPVPPEIDKLSRDDAETLRNFHMCVAHWLYLRSSLHETEFGVGSRGSQMTLAKDGVKISDQFPSDWKLVPENRSFRDQAFFIYLKTEFNFGLFDSGREELEASDTALVAYPFCEPVKPIPQTDDWFENVWRAYREGEIYPDIDPNEED